MLGYWTAVLANLERLSASSISSIKKSFSILLLNESSCPAKDNPNSFDSKLSYGSSVKAM
jgi:hypothetical protein